MPGYLQTRDLSLEPALVRCDGPQQIFSHLQHRQPDGRAPTAWKFPCNCGISGRQQLQPVTHSGYDSRNNHNRQGTVPAELRTKETPQCAMSITRPLGIPPSADSFLSLHPPKIQYIQIKQRYIILYIKLNLWHYQ